MRDKLPTYKDITELLKKGATLEAQEQIIALREGALELHEENIKLRERVKELEGAANLIRELEFHNGVYYRRKQDGTREGPFCPLCYDDKNKLIRLQSGLEREADTTWICLACEHTYG